jgi:2-oxo-3-hexenedioate decarboxylase
MSDHKALATTLDAAALRKHAIPQLTLTSTLSIGEAYSVQRHGIDLRLNRGERIIGMKLGFTSRAKMSQMGVHDLIWGLLTDGMIVEDGGHVDLTNYIHPRVEPEVAFLIGQRLSGTVTAAHALTTVRAVAPALEVIDSRYANFKFNLADVVADNCSSAGLVVGPWQPATGDLGNLGVLLELNGRAIQYGSTAAILGHPVRALAAAARLITTVGLSIEPGWVVLAGAATAAEPLALGMHVRACVERIGSASFSVSHAEGGK